MDAKIPIFRLVTLTISLTVACETFAQTPASEPDATEQAEKLVPRMPGEVKAFAPKPKSRTSPVRPGLTEGVDWESMVADPDAPTRKSRPLPERTFVNGVRGEMIEGPQGTRIFVPQPGQDDGMRRAVLVLPCGVLDRFDEFVMKKNTRAPVLISGRLFVYGNRNYLLPSSIRAAAHSDNATAMATPEENSENIEQPAPGSDAEIDSLIGELERRPVYSRRRSGRDTSAKTSGRGSNREREDPPAVLSSDEQYMSSLRGRVIRSADGAWIFVPDSDTDGPRASPMTMLPCRMLQSLEGHALREGDSSAVLLSGRVYRYQGARYILPTLYQRERRIGVEPLQ